MTRFRFTIRFAGEQDHHVVVAAELEEAMVILGRRAVEMRGATWTKERV